MKDRWSWDASLMRNKIERAPLYQNNGQYRNEEWE